MSSWVPIHIEFRRIYVPARSTQTHTLSWGNSWLACTYKFTETFETWNPEAQLSLRDLMHTRRFLYYFSFLFVIPIAFTTSLIGKPFSIFVPIFGILPFVAFAVVAFIFRRNYKKWLTQSIGRACLRASACGFTFSERHLIYLWADYAVLVLKVTQGVPKVRISSSLVLKRVSYTPIIEIYLFVMLHMHPRM